MPATKDDREDLSWVMCVLMMATRQLALVNKTGQVNFEINTICRTFVEWVRNIIQQHFMPFFSAMLFLSYDRVIAGYLTRQVATTFIATCARHHSECESTADAQTQILMDMETAPVTLQTCNLAICNAVTHLADTNLILVNQLIRDRLNTPVVPVEFIMEILNDEPLDMSSASYDAVFTWLSLVVQNRQNESECIMGYVSVAKLGTQEDYNCKEAYLESYFGIAKNNYYTYITAIKECCAKTFDLTNFLSMETPMLDFTRFTSRMGVGGDGMQQGYQQNPTMDNHHSTYLFTQAVQEGNQPQQQPQRYGITKSWVNVIQHLLITAIQGTKELHADNMFTFGANLTEFIMSRCAPIQSIPAGVSVLESYRHVHEEVVPLHLSVSPRPEYFVRTVNDHCAMETGTASELPAVLGNHPPEDVMHLGSWIQLYTILHNGNKPEVFQYFPSYNGRPPELVLGRVYPLLGNKMAGTLVLNGTANILISSDEENWEVLPPVKLKDWWKKLCELELMVAPLIFRNYAVFRTEVDRPPMVAVQHDNKQFLNQTGEYLLAKSADIIEPVSFSEAHSRLLPLGAHVFVRPRALVNYRITSTSDWIMGCLRYPEEATHPEDDRCQVYLTIRMKEVSGKEICVRVVNVSPEQCIIPDENQARRSMHNFASFAIEM